MDTLTLIRIARIPTQSKPMLNTGKQLIVIRLVLLLQNLQGTLPRGSVEGVVCFRAGEEERF
jgi:hypothetical protein